MTTLKELNIAQRDQQQALMNRMRGNKPTRNGKRNYAKKLRELIKPRGNVMQRLQFKQWYADVIKPHGTRKSLPPELE